MIEITIIGPAGEEADVNFDEKTREVIGVAVHNDSELPEEYKESVRNGPTMTLRWLRNHAGYQGIGEEEDWINGEDFPK